MNYEILFSLAKFNNNDLINSEKLFEQFYKITKCSNSKFYGELFMLKALGVLEKDKKTKCYRFNKKNYLFCINDNNKRVFKIPSWQTEELKKYKEDWAAWEKLQKEQ